MKRFNNCGTANRKTPASGTRAEIRVCGGQTEGGREGKKKGLREKAGRAPRHTRANVRGARTHFTRTRPRDPPHPGRTHTPCILTHVARRKSSPEAASRVLHFYSAFSFFPALRRAPTAATPSRPRLRGARAGERTSRAQSATLTKRPLPSPFTHPLPSSRARRRYFTFRTLPRVAFSTQPTPVPRFSPPLPPTAACSSERASLAYLWKEYKTWIVPAPVELHRRYACAHVATLPRFSRGFNLKNN